MSQRSLQHKNKAPARATAVNHIRAHLAVVKKQEQEWLASQQKQQREAEEAERKRAVSVSVKPAVSRKTKKRQAVNKRILANFAAHGHVVAGHPRTSEASDNRPANPLDCTKSMTETATRQDHVDQAGGSEIVLSFF